MKRNIPRAPRCFFDVDAPTLARRLLGQRLVRSFKGSRLSGVIVETEAYVGVRDAASHAHNGRRTARNESMYARGGTAYVYFTYGMHFCFNIVCGEVGDPQAVLVRGLDVVEGADEMQRLRARGNLRASELCSGPARLCRALAVDRSLDGEDLAESARIWVELCRERAMPGTQLVRCPRIGIGARAGEWVTAPLRWYVRGAAGVSVRVRSDRAMFGSRLPGESNRA